MQLYAALRCIVKGEGNPTRVGEALLSHHSCNNAPACFLRAVGKWAYYGTWLYCSLCMAVFLVRTLKRSVFQEARNYGGRA